MSLIHLIEECSEVIHAACKCERFGIDHTEPGYGNNREVLLREIEDLQVQIDNFKRS